MKGLIIDEPWIGLILQEKKTWEMLKTACHHRGRIALIHKGSGRIVGTADVIDSLQSLDTADAYARADSLRLARTGPYCYEIISKEANV